MMRFESAPSEKRYQSAEDALKRIQKNIASAEGLQDKREAFVMAFEAMKAHFESLGIESHDDLNDLERARLKSCLIRAEDAELVLDLLQGKDIELRSRIEARESYANVSQGSDIALPNLVVDALKISHRDLPNHAMIIGVRSDAKDIQIKKLPVSSDAVVKEYYKYASGTVHPKDIRFIVTGMPVGALPEAERNEREEELIDEGKSKVPSYRVFTFPDGIPEEAIKEQAA